MFTVFPVLHYSSITVHVYTHVNFFFLQILGHLSVTLTFCATVCFRYYEVQRFIQRFIFYVRKLYIYVNSTDVPLFQVYFQYIK